MKTVKENIQEALTGHRDNPKELFGYHNKVDMNNINNLVNAIEVLDKK